MIRGLFLITVLITSCTNTSTTSKKQLDEFKKIDASLQKSISYTNPNILYDTLKNQGKIDKSLKRLHRNINVYVDSLLIIKKGLLAYKNDNLNFSYKYLSQNKRFELIYFTGLKLYDNLLENLKDNDYEKDIISIKIKFWDYQTSFSKFKEKNFRLVPIVAATTILSIIVSDLQNAYLICLKSHL